MTDTAELDALIIRNLAEIEQGYDRINGEIEKQLDKEAAEIFKKVAEEYGWFSKATRLDEDFWLVKNAWQKEEGTPNKADHYLVVSVEADSKAPDVSWPQTFVGGQGSRLLLTIHSDAYTDSRWLRFLKEDKPLGVVERLTKRSRFRFEPDNKNEPLALPVRIDQEKLAQAFAGAIRFDEALAPLAAALKDIVGQEALLDELAGLAREADA